MSYVLGHWLAERTESTLPGQQQNGVSCPGLSLLLGDCGQLCSETFLTTRSPRVQGQEVEETCPLPKLGVETDSEAGP